MFDLDRQKYLKIAETQGVREALTQLHRETERWEHEAFEGSQGWNPAQWERIKQVREFSRELWNLALNPASSALRGR